MEYLQQNPISGLDQSSQAPVAYNIMNDSTVYLILVFTKVKINYEFTNEWVIRYEDYDQKA